MESLSLMTSPWQNCVEVIGLESTNRFCTFFMIVVVTITLKENELQWRSWTSNREGAIFIQNFMGTLWF